MKRKNLLSSKIIGRIPGAIVLAAAIYALSAVSGCQYTLDGNPDVDLTEVHVSPVAASVEVGGQLVLTASVLGFSNSSAVTWSVIQSNNGTSNGSITSDGIYTAPSAISSLQQIVDIKVTSSENANRSVIVPISILPPNGSFGSTPDQVTLLTNAVQQFTIDSEGDVPAQLHWKIVRGEGTITDAGLYTAPSSVPSDSLPIIISAVSNSDSTVYAQSTITIVNSSDSTRCFTRDILPVLSANCGMTSCHDNITHAAGYNFNTFEGTIKSVKPGNARGSRLFTSMTQINANDRMPPAPSPALSSTQVLKIGEWINEGAFDCQ